MIRWTRLVVGAIAGTLAGASCAAAQEVTVEQLVAMALERAPDIRAARAAIAVAGGQVTQSSLRPNPTVTIGQEGGGFSQTTFGLEWPLDLFRRDARTTAAHHAVEVTTLSVQDRERLLAASIREQAGRLLSANRTLEVMSESLTAARRTRELLDQRANEGQVPKVDANMAAVQVGRLEADQALATADVEVALIGLKALVGLAPDASLTVRDSLEALVRTPVPDQQAQAVAAALETRPDVREANARVALAEARIEEAQSGGRMDMTLAGGYGRMRFGYDQRGFDDAGRLVPIDGVFHTASVTARLTWPVRQKNEGAVEVAQAERSEAQETVAARQLAARAELDMAIARTREARRAVEVYNTSVLALAQQNVNVVLEAYDLGRAPLSDLLTEQRRYLEIEGGYTTVLSQAYQAGVALRRARGEIK